MKIVSSFKHLEHTPALDVKIQEKSQKLKKYLEGNFEVHWTCSIREDGAHLAEIKLFGPGIDYHAAAHSDRLYKSLDLVIAKIERQVQKRKDKWKKRINQKHNEPLKEKVAKELENDEGYWDNREDNEIAS